MNPYSTIWNSLELDSEDSYSTKHSINHRNYVDPWDVENYMYIRKHIDMNSIETSPRSAEDIYGYYSPIEVNSKERKHTRRRSKYAEVVECDFGNNQFQYSSNYYHLPYSDEDLCGVRHDYSDMEDIIEDEYPVVPDSSLLYMYETTTRMRKMAVPNPNKIYSPYQSTDSYYGDSCYAKKTPASPLEDIYNSSRKTRTIPIYDDLRTSRSRGRSKNKFGLGNYGHLKIDYSCSWNMLDRYIAK